MMRRLSKALDWTIFIAIVTLAAILMPFRILKKLVARCLKGVFHRLNIFIFALLRSLTILACTLVYGPLYVVGLASRPSGRRMLSSYVGQAAFNGHRWGRIAAWIIDHVMMQFGDGPDHCRRAYLHYRGLDD